MVGSDGELRVSGGSNANPRSFAQCFASGGKHGIDWNAGIRADLKQRLIVVGCKGGGKLGLYQCPFSAAVTALPDFQRIGGIFSPPRRILPVPFFHASNSSRQQVWQRLSPPGGAV